MEGEGGRVLFFMLERRTNSAVDGVVDGAS